jgi:hypothetical protein
MTIASEEAVNSMISDEIESESVTDAIASAREIVISVEDESAINNQPSAPDEVEAPSDVPSTPPTEPGPDEPEPGEK